MARSVQELEEEIFNSGAFRRTEFKGVIGAFFGLSVISVIARASIRIHTRRRLYLDDYLVLFGVVCLIGATAIVYVATDDFFLGDATQRDPSILSQLSPDKLNGLIFSVPYIDAFVSLVWTTIFFVKFSFLAFYKQLIKRVLKIQLYFKVVVGITIVAWLFVVPSPFVVCPHVGRDAVKCLDPSGYSVSVAMTGTITGLDILTDFMIVSIPMIVLWRTKIRIQQKLALGVLFSLSLVMVVIALVRVPYNHGVYGLNLRWEIFWMYMEGCVAILMASITSFRTAFVKHSTRESERRRQKPSSYSMIDRVRRFRSKKQSEMSEGSDELPTIPKATMTGIRTYIRRNNRTAGDTTMMHTVFEPLEGEEHDHHVYVKRDWRVEYSRARESGSSTPDRSRNYSAPLRKPAAEDTSLV